MAQPVKHRSDDMLDAARALVLAGGPAAASARGVSVATGAPSGSVYHRFPRRDDLVAAAWLRAQERFLREYLPALDGPDPVDAAVLVATWCTDHPQDGALLLRYSLADLVRGEVSPTDTDRAARSNADLGAALRSVAGSRRLPATQVVLALVDLPLACTRRILRERGGASAEEVAALRRAVRLLLG